MKKVGVSKIQKQFWILNEIYSKSGAYNLFSVFRLSKPMNTKYFQEAVKTVISRHDPLRTSFDFSDNELFQVIKTIDEISIPFFEINLEDNFDEEKIHSEIIKEVNRSFDLTKAPLCRFTLFYFKNGITVLTIVFHHIIVDVRSEGIFSKEFSEVYNALDNQKEPNLNSVPFQYSDYINEINPWYSSDEFKKKLETLAHVASDPTSNLKLPGDNVATFAENEEGSDVYFRIEKELSEKIKIFSSNQNINPFRFFLTAFAIFLNRLSNQDSFYIGLPLTNRTRPVSKSTFGCFINALPLQISISSDKTTGKLLKEVVDSLAILLDRQEIPFTDLVEFHHVERNSEINPYFQTGFAFKPPMQLSVEGVNAEFIKVEKTQHQTEFDFMLTLYPEDDTFIGYFEYSRQLFNRSTIARWIRIFKEIVVQLIEIPDLYIKDINILTDSDSLKLKEFNDNKLLIPDYLVQNYFEKQAEKLSSKIAVISRDIALTYKELDEQSNQIANYLLKHGARVGDVIGLCIERSVDMVSTVIGILKAGCCYLPMDPSFPDDRIKYMYEDSGATILITQSSLKDKFSDLSAVNLILADKEKDDLQKCSKKRPPLKIDQDTLAYIIYTSGSTGKPKGVKVPHRGVVNLIESMTKDPGITTDDVLLAVVTLSFDMSVFELFMTLSNGATLIVATSQDTTDGQSIADLIEKYKVTMLQATPSLWNILLSAGWKGKKDLRGFCGGEALTKNLVRRILPLVKEFWNCYGPTETTVYSTFMRVTDPEAPIVIGKPLKNTHIYILDKNNNQLPVGVVGEVCIGGSGVTKGYINKPELNAEKFITYKGETIYKAGDLGRFLTDGNIELFGRIDNQIKLRGFRIEPGEIEDLLSRLPGVREAVVKIHKFDENDDRLIAFLNIDNEFNQTNEDITGYLSQKVPAYMIPSFFQRSEGFPRLPNGKINKAALVLLIDKTEKKRNTDFDSLTPTQKKLAAIWDNILKIRNLDPTDNFFDAGGNSLLGIRVINKIKEEIGFTLSFKLFITNPTILKLGNYIDSQMQVKAKGINLKHLSTTTNLPLTTNQKRIWLISKLQPDKPSYIIPFNYKLTGSLDRDVFERSLEILFNRHHIIYSVIKDNNGEPYCDIVPSKINITYIDCSWLPDDEKNGKIDEIIKTDSQKIFDLQEGPLYRIYLVLTGKNEYFFRMSVHHIVFDGWSWSVLVKDLNEIYNSLSEGRKTNLEEIEFQQYDYAQWEISEDGEKNEAESVKFWENYLEGASTVLNFPYDFPRTDKSSGKASYVPVILSQEVSDKLKVLCKKVDVSLFSALIGIYGIQLQKYTGDNDLNLGLPVANRPFSKLENIFGMFVNTVAIRLRYSNEMTFREILMHTNESALNAIAHQDLPFEKVVEIVNPERSFNTNPLFQVGFAWQNNLEIPLNLIDVKSERIAGIDRTSIFDIILYLWESDDHIEGEFEYNVDILKRNTIIRLKDNFIHTLQTVISEPDRKISELSLVSENDKEKLLEFNSTQVDLPDYLIYNFFENKAKEVPSKIAVTSRGQSITYKDLDNRSNQLANCLLNIGIKAGDFIGVCIERSLDMVVSVFGILKAGCCYLPMDPSFPDDRLKYMFEDSGAKVIISQSSLKDKFEKFNNARIIYTDLDQTLIDQCSNIKPELSIDSHYLAYIIYTSGSTGKPKGVKVHHQAVVNFLNSMSKRPGISSDDRLLAVTTLSFDISVLELFLPLSFGAEVVVANANDIFDGQNLSELIDLYDITVMQATPATWSILLNSGWKGKGNLKALCGGEAIPSGLVKELLEKVGSLWNMYGPTETTVWSTCGQLVSSEIPVLIGTPIDNTVIYITDSNNNIVPVGVIGEVCIGGLGVTKGYHNRPDLTYEKFIQFENGQTVYKTGDLGRFLEDGRIELFGRSDNQIKLRGFRIEPGEIESLLSRLTGIREAVVKVQQFEDIDERLVAFLNADANFSMKKEEITEFLSQNLPAYMIPSFIKVSVSFPRLPNGKINKKALILTDVDLSQNSSPEIDSLTETQKKLLETLKHVLKINSLGISTNFFEAGGTSILIPRIIVNLKNKYNISIKPVNIFEYPNVKSLAEFITNKDSKSKVIDQKKTLKENVDSNDTPNRDIAVIGMAGYFPGAEDLEQFWDNIKNGKVSINFSSRQELKEKGIPEDMLNNQDYVFANSLVNMGDMFDSAFFEITPREADLMDPQHRIFLEVCYEALENAGYAPRTEPRNIGVFAGSSINNYLLKSLIKNPEVLRSFGEFQTMVNNDKDFLTTRVSYKLNLTGPSIDIQTACSTSMVATHIACQSLYNHECDMALSGGVSIQFPRGHGYLYKKGAILSPSGFCRPFDEKADGTVVGEGAGVILLKRLYDAIKDKDNIYAVIKSTAINNDGSEKVGYMAPSLDGQSKVILQAQEQAGITPDTISFIETHGTGTKLGDPIEVGALKKVFSKTQKKGPYCALGGVKANIGHLDAASGIAGIIKTILALRHRQIPPLSNFESYNKELELENSPFYVTTELKEWKSDNLPRRAGVSSFGIGGTNAHCIIEEWNQDKPHNSIAGKTAYYLLPVTAMSQSSLDSLSDDYRLYFENTMNNISDIAYTMQLGREMFKYRQLFITDDLKQKSHFISSKGTQLFEKPAIAFMFTGQGSQYMTMSKGLYESFPTFKKYIDKASDLLKKEFGTDLLKLLFNSDNPSDINETVNSQPALVAVQYATVKLLAEYGIQPDILIGHSIGELTAACVSGVFSFHDILLMAARRGKIMHEQKRGLMLSVNLPADKLRKILIPGIEISLMNSPEYSVVSGDENSILYFRNYLQKTYPGLQTVILKTSHAFHSALMDPAVEPFKNVVEKILRKEVGIPFISNTSGALITNEEAQSSEYWSNHIRKPVNFSAGVRTLIDKQTIILEIGPGSSLTSLLSQFKTEKGFKAIPTMRGAKQDADDTKYFLNSIAQFWISGGEINWSDLYKEAQYKVPVPTYHFTRKRHWIDTKSYFSFDYDTDGHSEDTNITERSEENTSITIDRSSFTEEYVKPGNETQKVLIAIWENYLGLKYIGLIDDFFSMGGHSLLASQVVNQVNKHFKTDLPVDCLFRTPTIEKFARLVEDTRKKTTSQIDLKKVELSGNFPITVEQKRLWTIAQIDNNPSYNIPFTYKFKGNVDEEILCKSLEEVFRRHSILLGRIIKNDGKPVMVIDKAERVKIDKIDFTGVPDNEKQKRIDDFITEDVRRLFNLDNDQLYRLYLIRTGNEEIIFHFIVHHIIFDGWSWGVFVKDLKEAYKGLLNNGEFRLSYNVNQYFEYAQWQMSTQADRNPDKSIDYWKKQLRGCIEQINFPYNLPRKERRSGLGGKEFFIIDQEINSRLKKMAKEQNMTDFMIYISVFSVLLNKYSKDSDICIGIPVANRTNTQFEDIIGFFVNSLVLRFRLDENCSFSEYLIENRKMILEALEHQELPFEKLVEAVQPVRVLNCNPIFQILFAWLNTPTELFEFPGVVSERCSFKRGVAPLDISIYIWEENGLVQGEIEYSTDILTPEYIHLIISNYIELLKNISQDGQKKIIDLNVISAADIEKQKEFNQTEAQVQHPLLHQSFEVNAQKYPNEIAVISKEGSLTYSELDRRANQLAHYLIKNGVREKDFVGISLDRTFNMLISVLAVLKTGAAYLPLDPYFPADRLRFYASDAGASLIITQNAHSAKFNGISANRICFEDIAEELNSENSSKPVVNISKDDLAYIIYTSGSTGIPKGVKILHRGASNFITSASEIPGINHDDRLLAITTLSFDISVLEIFLPFSKGSTIVLAHNSDIANGEALQGLINNFKVTLLQATPATWHILLNSGWKGNKDLRAFVGGEALPPSLAESLLPKVKGLWNFYGPTETTIWSTVYHVTDANPPILIGKPVMNTTIFIISEDNRLQPIGVAGEICIGGDGLAQGYHNRPELTGEKFTKGPDGRIIYKTGDIGRILPDGNIEIFGRIDNQVKIRGFRIELGEIEAQLCKIPGIEKAVAKVEKFSDLDIRLVSFIIVNSQYNDTRESLSAKLRVSLPEYMVPKAFKVVTEFPLTPNNKIDRKALSVDISDFISADEIKDTEAGEKIVATDLEKKILDIWINELGMKNIGLNDNFFDIGGNSVLIIQLADKINNTLGRKVDVLHYFQYPTIKSFYNFLQKEGALLESQSHNSMSDQPSRKSLIKKRKRI